MALSTSIVESKSTENPVSSFNMSQLKDLFTYRPETACDTHDLLCCRCCGKFNRIPIHQRNAINISELQTWSHFIDIAQVREEVLRKTAENLPEGVITFFFRKSVNEKSTDAEEEEEEPVMDDNQVQVEELQFV